MNLTDDLAKEYLKIWGTMTVRADKLHAANAVADRIIAHRARYEAVAAKTGVPWYFIAAVHSLEADGNFGCHLHNGDPLTHRTVHVPKGRPLLGDPPFTWEESAVDSLRYEGLHAWPNWSLTGLLYQLEAYNGWGYRKYHAGHLTPYLWSWTSAQTPGKYVEDGVWDSRAWSDQCGAAAIVRCLADKGAIELPKHDPF